MLETMVVCWRLDPSKIIACLPSPDRLYILPAELKIFDPGPSYAY